MRRLALALAVVTAAALRATAAPIDVEVDAAVRVEDVRRIGMNLGSWTSWGAEQLLANVLRNPGFEGIVDRSIVVVARVDPDGFADDTPRLGRADGFWAGATYEVRTGAAAGRRGIVVDSRRAGPSGLPTFRVRGAVPPVALGDVVAVTRTDDESRPAQWWIGDAIHDLVAVEPGARAPGSPGARALVLRTAPGRRTEISSFLDAIGSRAGNLLPVRGRWRLAVWARGDGEARLAVRFARHGTAAFVDRELVPGAAWERHLIEFEAPDDGPPGTLELRFTAQGTGGRVLLDDVELGPAPATTAFRPEVEAALAALRPGYLRDWQGQNGDTLANRLAGAFARRSSRTAPGGAEAIGFAYGLPEFLDLCARVGSAPWVVVPPTLGDEELRGLGRFLAERAAAQDFAEILVEFGNENWNPLFRAAGIPDPRAHAAAADRAFRLLRDAAGPSAPLRTVVNGQHANPEVARATLAAAAHADVLAVAPYVLPSLEAGTPPATSLTAMFAGDGGRLAALAHPLGKTLAVAEVNLHTLAGGAPAAERDVVTAGAAAGAALARRLLDALALGVRHQCVYTLAGYDTHRADRQGFVRLFGVTRDLGPTCRFRPTGLAVAMLNRALGGSLHDVQGALPPTLTVAALRQPTGWSAVLVSAAAEPQEVRIAFPLALGPPPVRMLSLEADSPLATNEDAEAVRVVDAELRRAGRTVELTVPAFGLVVLPPRGAPQ